MARLAEFDALSALAKASESSDGQPMCAAQILDPEQVWGVGVWGGGETYKCATNTHMLTQSHSLPTLSINFDMGTTTEGGDTISYVLVPERSSSLLVHQTCVAPTIGTDRQ